MRYKVPREIEHKAKIVGPATFTQLLYIGAAGLLALFLYFIMGKTPMFYFLSFLIGTLGVALAFLQVAGQPLPEYLKKLFLFSFSSKEYLWEKKIIPMETIITTSRKPVEEKKEEEDRSLRSGKMSNISSKIETF